MKNEDVAIAYVSFEDGGGKKRPIFVLSVAGSKLSFYKISSQYENKPKKIKKYYCPIKYWREAHLNKPSWIDTVKIYTIDVHKTEIRPYTIGRLTYDDAEHLADFLEKERPRDPFES